MTASSHRLERLDTTFTAWMHAHSITCLRVALGLIFLWFGVLKFFPGQSPAEILVGRTIAKLTFDVVPMRLSLPLLATIECVIGLGLLTRRFMTFTLLLLFVQMIGTLLPLVFFSQATFTHVPYAPTLEGQYIIKNSVLISAAMVLWSMSRVAHFVPIHVYQLEPATRQDAKTLMRPIPHEERVPITS